MPFVKASDLSEWLKTSVDAGDAGRHIAVAEALVAGAMGAESFEATQVDETHRILYDMDRHEAIEVRSRRPISQMLQIFIDGTEQDLSDFEVRHWTVKRIDDTKIPKNSDVRLVFNAGYEEDPADSSGAGGMPENVKNAVIITAAEAFKSPDTQFDAEQIGDYAYKRSASVSKQASHIPERAMLLLRGFRRPGSLL